MKNNCIAFEIYNSDPNTLIGYQECTTHLIFNIKISERFRRKARLVADGHKTKYPATMTYSSVVSWDSVRICLLIAALNDVDIPCGDIQNAYLTAHNKENIWCKAGPEFGSESGKTMIIVRALYGIKSAGGSFRSFLALTIDDIGFTPS